MRSNRDSNAKTGDAPPSRTVRRRASNGIRRVSAAALLLLLVEGGWALFGNPYFRITRVDVQGNRILSPATVYQEARIDAGGNLFWTAMHNHIVSRLLRDPVIKGAAIRIRPAHTLVVRIQERRPRINLIAQGSCYLLDGAYVPFRVLSRPWPGLPIIVLADHTPDAIDLAQRSAVSAQEPKPAAAGGAAIALGSPVPGDWLQGAYKVAAAMPADLAGCCIEVDPRGNMCLNRPDGLRILLGPADDLSAKLATAETLVHAEGGAMARAAAYIDVTSPDQSVWMPRSAAGRTGGTIKAG